MGPGVASTLETLMLSLTSPLASGSSDASGSQGLTQEARLLLLWHHGGLSSAGVFTLHFPATPL